MVFYALCTGLVSLVFYACGDDTVNVNPDWKLVITGATLGYE